jgi:hypothetical protein
MIYSLINVSKEHSGGYVDGYWIQDCIGDLNDAIERAKSTNEVNDNMLNIAIVSKLNSTTPLLNYWTNLKKLN